MSTFGYTVALTVVFTSITGVAAAQSASDNNAWVWETPSTSAGSQTTERVGTACAETATSCPTALGGEIMRKAPATATGEASGPLGEQLSRLRAPGPAPAVDDGSVYRQW